MTPSARQPAQRATFVEQAPAEGATHEVCPGDTVGRSGTDIVLYDPQVSREHAAFRGAGAGIGVEDLGSRNGTHVNERRIGGLTALSEGDTVRFGDTVWRLQSLSRLGAAPVPSGLQRGMRAEVTGQAPQFDPGRSPRPILGGSAARAVGATVYSYAVIVATAVAIAIYFALR